MNDLPTLVLMFLGGAGLGAFFFLGLWVTVRKGLASSVPALWFVGSLVVRYGVVLVGFTLIAEGHWSNLIIAMIGFLMARIVVVNYLAWVPDEPETLVNEETGFAPDSR